MEVSIRKGGERHDDSSSSSFCASDLFTRNAHIPKKKHILDKEEKRRKETKDNVTLYVYSKKKKR